MGVAKVKKEADGIRHVERETSPLAHSLEHLALGPGAKELQLDLAWRQTSFRYHMVICKSLVVNSLSMKLSENAGAGPDLMVEFA